MTHTHTIRLGEHAVEVIESRKTDGIIRKHRIGVRRGDVSVYINAAALGEYARKAIKNRSGSAQIANGAIRFVAHNTKLIKDDKP